MPKNLRARGSSLLRPACCSPPVSTAPSSSASLIVSMPTTADRGKALESRVLASFAWKPSGSCRRSSASASSAAGQDNGQSEACCCTWVCTHWWTGVTSMTDAMLSSAPLRVASSATGSISATAAHCSWHPLACLSIFLRCTGSGCRALPDMLGWALQCRACKCCCRARWHIAACPSGGMNPVPGMPATRDITYCNRNIVASI